MNKKEKILTIAMWVTVAFASLPLLYFGTRIFVCDRFVSKGVSMLPTMRTGSGIYVNKLILGGRIYTKFDFDTPELHCFRMPGLRRLRVGDVAVFNYPFGWRNDEIGFKINYVYIKRCIGVPGDSVSIRNAHYVNSRTGATGVPKASEDMLRSIPDELLLERKSLKAGQFAGKGDEWTIKDFGPILVPGEGLSIRLDRDNALRYAKVIEYETGEKLGISEDGVTIGGNPSSAYTFSGNWYFFVGDNAANSRDSRYFGFVPEDFVIGVVPKYSERIR